MRILLAIPVYNEEKYVEQVLSKVRRYAPGDVLIIDDGSTDTTPMLLARQPVEVIRHAQNRGYGRSLANAFCWAHVGKYDWLITMDCDEQHEPESIPTFLEAIQRDDADVISGSRYLRQMQGNDVPPGERQQINHLLTDTVNSCLNLQLTDTFCGFKAYRVDALRWLDLSVDGYAFPMQFWVQAAAHRLRIREIPVRLIYNDADRTFGGPLDDAEIRLAHYRHVFAQEIAKYAQALPSIHVNGKCNSGAPCSC
jgi:glycosyltransferase involved in cell wall biosynthesis